MYKQWALLFNTVQFLGIKHDARWYEEKNECVCVCVCLYLYIYIYTLHCTAEIDTVNQSYSNKKITCGLTPQKNISITESLCCAAEINTTLQINYTSIEKKTTKISLHAVGEKKKL